LWSARSAAGAEIEATFLAERLARNPELLQCLEGSWLRRTGRIARLDASVPGGGAVLPKSRATLPGGGLSIEHDLGPVEQQILDRMEGRVAGSELLHMGREFAMKRRFANL